MPFLLPVDPVTGSLLPNWIPRYWANNNRWLHARATQTWDTFTGSDFSWNQTLGLGEKDCWRGWLLYQGVATLLTDIVSSGGIGAKLYITDNASEHLMGAISATMDISVDGAAVAMSYTVGQKYKVRVTQGLAGAGTCSCTVYRVVIRTTNAFAPFPTLPTMADAAVPTAASFALISLAQQYLNAMLTPVGSSCYVGLVGTGSPALNYVGSFYMRGLGSSLQRSLTIQSLFQNGTATLYVYDGSNALQFTQSLPVTGAENTQTYTVTGTFTAGTYCRIIVTTTSTQFAHVTRVTVGGAVALSHAVPSYASLDEVRGNSGAKQFYYLGNENLADIRAILRPATDVGFQFLAPDQTLGQPVAVNAPFVGPTSERDYTYRTLHYLPAGPDATVKYGLKSQGLPDSNAGGWATFDLSGISDLAPGMSLTVNGVKACFQS